MCCFRAELLFFTSQSCDITQMCPLWVQSPDGSVPDCRFIKFGCHCPDNHAVEDHEVEEVTPLQAKGGGTVLPDDCSHWMRNMHDYPNHATWSSLELEPD